MFVSNDDGIHDFLLKNGVLVDSWLEFDLQEDDDIIDWYDGPLIFLLRKNNNIYLSYILEEFFYFVIQVQQNEVNDFLDNKIDIYDFLNKEKMWCFEIDKNSDVKNCWELNKFPSQFLPEKGVRLRAEKK